MATRQRLSPMGPRKENSEVTGRAVYHTTCLEHSGGAYASSTRQVWGRVRSDRGGTPSNASCGSDYPFGLGWGPCKSPNIRGAVNRLKGKRGSVRENPTGKKNLLTY